MKFLWFLKSFREIFGYRKIGREHFGIILNINNLQITLQLDIL